MGVSRSSACTGASMQGNLNSGDKRKWLDLLQLFSGFASLRVKDMVWILKGKGRDEGKSGRKGRK